MPARVCAQTYTDMLKKYVVMCACCWVVIPDAVERYRSKWRDCYERVFPNQAAEYAELNCCTSNAV